VGYYLLVLVVAQRVCEISHQMRVHGSVTWDEV
jgi:hypothetical protein